MPFLALLTGQSPVSDFGRFPLEILESNTVPAAAAAADDEVLRLGGIHKYVSSLMNMLNFPGFLCCMHPTMLDVP